MHEKKKHARVLVRKHEVKTLVDSPTCRWEDIELVLQEQVGCCECGNKPLHSIKCGELLEKQRTVSFSSMARLQAGRQ
jgi:hypothetical protein